jgi:hypothetical protein
VLVGLGPLVGSHEFRSDQRCLVFFTQVVGISRLETLHLDEVAPLVSASDSADI